MSSSISSLKSGRDNRSYLIRLMRRALGCCASAVMNKGSSSLFTRSLYRGRPILKAVSKGCLILPSCGCDHIGETGDGGVKILIIRSSRWLRSLERWLMWSRLSSRLLIIFKCSLIASWRRRSWLSRLSKRLSILCKRSWRCCCLSYI